MVFLKKQMKLIYQLYCVLQFGFNQLNLITKVLWTKSNLVMRFLSSIKTILNFYFKNWLYFSWLLRTQDFLWGQAVRNMRSPNIAERHRTNRNIWSLGWTTRWPIPKSSLLFIKKKTKNYLNTCFCKYYLNITNKLPKYLPWVPAFVLKIKKSITMLKSSPPPPSQY